MMPLRLPPPGTRLKFQFPHQLDADGAAGWRSGGSWPAGRGESAGNRNRYRAGECGTAGPRAEVVNTPDPDAVARVVDAPACSRSRGGGGPHQLEQPGEARPRHTGRRHRCRRRTPFAPPAKPAAQRAAVAAVLRMGHHAQPGAELAGKAAQHFAGGVAAAIVNHDHFVAATLPFQRGKRLADQRRGDGASLYRREEDAQRWEFAGLQGYTIFLAG